jgi:chemotaxis protein methyltransferase CheR
MVQANKVNPHLKPLEQVLAARYGWQGGATWRDHLLAAIDRKAAKLGLDDLVYSRMAATSPGEQEALAEIICNSETRFFREPEQFEALRQRVIPELIAVRGKERRLDLWCAACSTGEEAYSLAIVVNEGLPAGGHWKPQLMATDLRGSAIMAASQGSYPQSSIRLIDADLRHRYFVRGDMHGRERHYSIEPNLRKMITFRRANIYDAKFWKHIHRPFDLIVCNNLLLYFHALAIRQTVERFAEALRPGGRLVVMKNEAGYIRHSRLKGDSELPVGFFVKA